MPTLAPKLPWTHPFAGGYPRIGGQPLPTDPDAIDYLSRVAAADGAAVEVGVAMAVDAFVKGCKADGTWSALKASCILCGARTISGALVPLVGPSPTAYPQPVNFVSSDYSRTTGLKGDGATKYLDSNRSCDADGQDNRHWAFFATTALSNLDYCFGADIVTVGFSNSQVRVNTENFLFCSSPNAVAGDAAVFVNSGAQGFHGASRDNSASFVARSAGSAITATVSSATPPADNLFIFARNTTTGAQSHASTRLAFYSIGSSLDLAALDNRVSTLVSAIAAAI